jgi:hypothetical protein
MSEKKESTITDIIEKSIQGEDTSKNFVVNTVKEEYRKQKPEESIEVLPIKEEEYNVESEQVAPTISSEPEEPNEPVVDNTVEKVGELPEFTRSRANQETEDLPPVHRKGIPDILADEGEEDDPHVVIGFGDTGTEISFAKHNYVAEEPVPKKKQKKQKKKVVKQTKSIPQAVKQGKSVKLSKESKEAYSEPVKTQVEAEKPDEPIVLNKDDLFADDFADLEAKPIPYTSSHENDLVVFLGAFIVFITIVIIIAIFRG